MTLNPPILGMYQTNGAFPTPGASAWPSGPTTNLSATYVAWGQDFSTYAGGFINECKSNGLVPFVELEPWNSGINWNVTPLFSDITGGTWDTWLESIGTFIAGTGKECILTFAHEMNVSGQYPWSQGDTGSGPGGGALTSTEWQAGWKYVHDKVNSTAGGLAKWMWACSAWTGGTTVDPSPWWPGSSYVDYVGIDGYPNTQYGQALGTFSGQIGKTVTAIRNLGWTQPIFLAETNLASMVASGGQSITSFVRDMYNAGCSGILEFEDASWNLPQMSSAQWKEYNTAIAANFGNVTSGGGTGGGTGGSPGSTGGASTVTKITADEVSSVSGVATSLTSFSPVAGSMVRVCATWLDAVDLLGKTFTAKDSNGVNYATTLAGGDSDGGCYLLIFDHVYSTAPGSITIEITCSNTATADCLIQPYVITGQASDQSLAAHNSVYGNTSITTCEISLTPTELGSLVFVLGAPNNANHPIPTGVSGTITDSEWDDDNVGSHGVIGRSSGVTTALTATTYGWTLNTASIYGFGCIASEVLIAAPSSGGSGSGSYTQTIIDNFDDNSFNSNLWTLSGDPADVSETGGELHVRATTNYTLVVSPRNFDLTSGFFGFKWSYTGTPLSTSLLGLGLNDDSDNQMIITSDIADNSWSVYTSGTITNTASTGDQTAFTSEWTSGDWLGIGMIAAGVIHVYKSSDTTTWTEIATISYTGAFNANKVGLILSSGDSAGTTSYYGIFDDVSTFVPSTVQTIKVRSGGAWVDSVPKVRVGGAWVAAAAKVRIGGAWVALSSSSSGGDGGGGGSSYTQTLIDDFTSGSLSGTIWDTPLGTDGISVVSGTVHVQGLSGDEQVLTVKNASRNLSAGIFAFQFSQSGTTSTDTMWFLGLTDSYSPLGNYYEFQAFPINSSWYSWADGSGATTSGDTGSQNILSPSVWSNGDWLGIGNYNLNGTNDVHVYKSSDGSTWTEIASFTVTGAINESAVYFYFGTNYNPGAPSSDYVAAVDNVSWFTR